MADGPRSAHRVRRRSPGLHRELGPGVAALVWGALGIRLGVQPKGSCTAWLWQRANSVGSRRARRRFKPGNAARRRTHLALSVGRWRWHDGFKLDPGQACSCRLAVNLIFHVLVVLDAGTAGADSVGVPARWRLLVLPGLAHGDCLALSVCRCCRGYGFKRRLRSANAAAAALGSVRLANTGRGWGGRRGFKLGGGSRGCAHRLVCAHSVGVRAAAGYFVLAGGVEHARVVHCAARRALHAGAGRAVPKVRARYALAHAVGRKRWRGLLRFTVAGAALGHNPAGPVGCRRRWDDFVPVHRLAYLRARARADAARTTRRHWPAHPVRVRGSWAHLKLVGEIARRSERGGRDCSGSN